MGAGIQIANGKAFEYACVIALHEQLSGWQTIVIEDSSQMETARKLYNEISEDMKPLLDAAARAAVRIIKKLEPQLIEANGNEPLQLSLQADAAGIKGDVRDVLCIRKPNGWEIGLSCKHNHHVVKHSRLSDTIDFGQEWLGVPCSKEYFDKVVPLFAELREIRDKSKLDGRPALWSDVAGKAEKYYIPVLRAFIMNIPVPPVFLYEEDYASYVVMDGLQRISAIMDFYRDVYELKGLEEWSELNGKRYSELPKKFGKESIEDNCQ